MKIRIYNLFLRRNNAIIEIIARTITISRISDNKLLDLGLGFGVTGMTGSTIILGRGLVQTQSQSNWELP